MANHFSALKRVRIERKRTLINRARRSRVRHQVRTMRRLLDHKKVDEAKSMVPKTFSLIDRAAKWGIVKKNTAARYKSRIAAKLKALLAPAA